MLIAGAVAAWVLSVKAGRADATSSANIANPFSLRSALTFGALFALTLLVVRAAQEYVGAGGMYVAAALSSLADVDAAAIAFARLGGEAAWGPPATAVAVAVVTNTLVKLGISLTMGTGRFRRYVTTALSIIAPVGAVAGA